MFYFLIWVRLHWQKCIKPYTWFTRMHEPYWFWKVQFFKKKGIRPISYQHFSFHLKQRPLSPPADRLQGQQAFGDPGRSGGQLLSPSLPPPLASCCFWGREQREGPENGSPLTGTISQFLTLGAWWVFKAFLLWSIFVVSQETLCCVPTAAPFRWAVSLLQLPFPNPPSPPWCSPHS